MLDLLLAALLAQTTPAPLPSATPDAMSEPTSVATGTTPSPTGMPAFRSFPAGPRRIPIELPTTAPGDVLIRNSGSTNTAGYIVVIHPDYTADVADGHGGTIKKTVGAAQAKWLFDKLNADLPFTQLGGGHCMKSASFGSYTTIVYDGQTTPDLQCPGGPEARELDRTIGIIIGQLGITTTRKPGMMRL